MYFCTYPKYEQKYFGYVVTVYGLAEHFELDKLKMCCVVLMHTVHLYLQ